MKRSAGPDDSSSHPGSEQQPRELLATPTNEMESSNHDPALNGLLINARIPYLAGSDSGTGQGPERLLANMNILRGWHAGRPLIPVYDQFPLALGDHSQAYLKACSSGTGAVPEIPERADPWLGSLFPASASALTRCMATERADRWIGSFYPLVIGLGPTAEHFLDHLPGRCTLPKDVGLYRSGIPGNTLGGDWLQQRLARCDVVLVIVDWADPQARTAATHWARLLDALNVYLRAMMVVNAPSAPQDQAWLTGLGLPVLKVHHDETTLDPANILMATLRVLPFMEWGLPGYDPCDIRCTLNTGQHAMTTAVRWDGRDGMASAVEKAYKALSPRQCCDALQFLTTTPDFSLEEITDMSRLIEVFFPDAGHTDILIPSTDLQGEERILSVTLIES